MQYIFFFIWLSAIGTTYAPAKKIKCSILKWIDKGYSSHLKYFVENLNNEQLSRWFMQGYEYNERCSIKCKPLERLRISYNYAFYLHVPYSNKLGVVVQHDWYISGDFLSLLA